MTYGFFEWAGAAGEDFGGSRLEEAIRWNGDLPPAAIIEARCAAVLQFVGDMPQQDDLTAVAVKRI